MCGILGIGGRDGPEQVAKLLAGLARRGPDDEGRWHDPALALGHRRLAIIGLDEGGRQPRVAEDGSVIVFNGEIYNYLELADALEAEGHAVDRRYDTAVLMRALAVWGTAALERLNGMFAFAWYRPDARRLLLVRDRWGKKPLFWGRVADARGRRRLMFSSDLRSFVRLAGGAPALDPLGVARYLVYDGMPGTRTVYRDVSKVPAGGWLELGVEGEVLRSGRFGRHVARPEPIDIDDAVDALDTVLGDALSLRLRSDVPVGLFLSGGLDSSLLAAAWHRRRPDVPLVAFTVGFDEPSYDERASARAMARAVGAEHHEIVAGGLDLERELDFVWRHLPEPFADPSLVPMSLICRFARRRVTVALGGDGADELQAGYDPFRAWAPGRALDVLPRKRVVTALRTVAHLLPVSNANLSLRFKIKHFAQGLAQPPETRIQGFMASVAPAEVPSLLHPDLAREVDPEALLAPSRRAFEAARAEGELAAQIRTWIDTYLECSILTKLDRAGMMHGLEVRAPFLDPAVAELCARLPTALVFRRGRGKQLLRRLARRRLPARLLRKPKKGLGVPQAEWLRTRLRPRMEDAVARASRGDGWVDGAALERRWQRHLARRDDDRRALWNVLLSSPFW